jgi:hypothetical protein
MNLHRFRSVALIVLGGSFVTLAAADSFANAHTVARASLALGGLGLLGAGGYELVRAERNRSAPTGPTLALLLGTALVVIGTVVVLLL